MLFLYRLNAKSTAGLAAAVSTVTNKKEASSEKGISINRNQTPYL